MGRRLSVGWLSLLAALGTSAAWADDDNLLSVAKPATSAKKPAVAKPSTSLFARPAAIPASTTSAAPATSAVQPGLQQPAPSGTVVESPVVGADGAVAPMGPSQFLAAAQAQFKASPNPATFAEFHRVFKAFLAQPSVAKMSAAAIIKANPVLAELGVKVIEAGSGRVWTFPRIPHGRDIVVQWHDTKATTTYVGRRRRIKRVTYTTVSHMQSLTLPGAVALKDARVIGGEEGARYLVLVGDDRSSSLWLHAFKAVNGGWVDSPSHFDSIPSFLTENMSGRVSFRGSDMIFNVGRVVAAGGEQATRLPETESSTYKFWLKLTETGYVLQKHVPDIAQFGVVRQFLEAVAGNRTDVARSLLTDSKLLSIPKYVGVRGPSSTFRVVQMASPPSGAPRFRIITSQRNDLIFEVARVKNPAVKDHPVTYRPVIRAIFIAPVDLFLQEISKILPTYDQLVPPVAAPTDTTAAEAKHP